MCIKYVYKMCKLCTLLKNDNEYREKISNLYNEINEKVKSTKRLPLEERKVAGADVVAFSTMPFPLLNIALFEPRMGLQIPSNFYQSIVVDGKKLRSDWASGWTRIIGFKENSLCLLAQGFRKHEGIELLIYLHMIQFEKGEFSFSQQGNKFVVSVKDVKKKGLDLINDTNTEHIYSFSFVHQPTERGIVPKSRITSSALVKTAYHGELTQKPLTFDFSQYVVTVPHFALYPTIHQAYKRYGYNSAIEMQNNVSELLKEHLDKF